MAQLLQYLSAFNAQTFENKLRPCIASHIVRKAACHLPCPQTRRDIAVPHKFETKNTVFLFGGIFANPQEETGVFDLLRF